MPLPFDMNAANLVLLDFSNDLVPENQPQLIDKYWRSA
jgi:hypothetical protein